jgi:hypothetical protein
MRIFPMLGRAIIRWDRELNARNFGYVRSAALSISISATRWKWSLAHLDEEKRYE